MLRLIPSSVSRVRNRPFGHVAVLVARPDAEKEDIMCSTYLNTICRRSYPSAIEAVFIDTFEEILNGAAAGICSDYRRHLSVIIERSTATVD